MTDTAAAHTDGVDPREGSSYPEAFRKHVATRRRRVLGDLVGLGDFGVNHVELPPGAWSSQRHWHTLEDEFIYVLTGELTLITDAGPERLEPGMFAGFPAGARNGHHLVNNSKLAATYLEIGSRKSGDEAFYPDIDLQWVNDKRGENVFTHRDGTPYDK